MGKACTVDFHTHINWQAPAALPADVLRIVSVKPEDIDNALPLNCQVTLELHPWQEQHFSDDFARCAARKCVIGIGEAGLDRIKGALELNEQKNIFIKCAALAQDLHKPLTVHCVKCFPELLEIYKKMRWQVPTIIHYFCSKAVLAQQLWRDTDFFLSLPPAALLRQDLVEFIKNNPGYLGRIVLETDDPNGDITNHYRTFAGTVGISEEKLQQIMFEQYQRIYSL